MVRFHSLAQNYFTMYQRIYYKLSPSDIDRGAQSSYCTEDAVWSDDPQFRLNDDGTERETLTVTVTPWGPSERMYFSCMQ